METAPDATVFSPAADAEHWLRSLADTLPHIAWLGDARGEIIYLNFTAREAIQARAGRPLQDAWRDALHEEDRRKFFDAWNNSAKAGRGPFQLEFRLWSHPHRAYRWRLGAADVLRTDVHSPHYWLGTCLDVHERKLAEETAQATAGRLRTALEGLPIGLAILDRNSRLVSWNPRYAQLRGKPSDLSAWVKALHPDDRERVFNSQARALARAESWADTYRFMHPDGRIVWVSARGVPLRDGQELLGFVVALEDITALKAAEEKLHSANQELQMHTGRLEQEVRHRTAKAQEALYELERLGYSIVHDMRSPLRTVQSYAQILLQGYSDRLDDQARGMLRRMADATRRQDHLIQDVLTYHSYVREEFPLTPVDLDDLVERMVEMYTQFQPPKAIVHVRKPLGWVLAHETLLTQCASVLLNNAVKFVARGVTPEIAVWTERRDSTIRLWVQDNGIGIAPEYHTRIFNIFETLHPSAIFPGTGIGLPLAKKAVEKMHGLIGVESDVGKGARFWLDLQPIPPD